MPRQRPSQRPANPELAILLFLVVVNKYDEAHLDEDFSIPQELLREEWPLLPVQVTPGRNLERLKQAIFERLDIIRGAKPLGQEPDFGTPFVLRQGGTVEEFAGKIHQDFLAKLKSARVCLGMTVYDGQMVGRDHILHDGDVVELRL